jgi:formylglycine-generating enzyme required for sulfatase activity
MRWSLLALCALASSGGPALRIPSGGTSTLVARRAERVVIPAGPFQMGSSDAAVKAAYELCTDEYRGVGVELVEASLRCTARFDGEGPDRSVVLPAFAIDRTEVTVGAYRVCVREGRCDRAPLVEARRVLRGDGYPIEAVAWDDADGYCRFRGGRLPSEAEWEKAARGVLGATWPWGERWEGGRANHGRRERPTESGMEGGLDASDGYEGAAPAGSFPGGATVYGVLDMAGNVWEWTSDFYAREPPQVGTRFAPRGPLGAGERVLRGGSYATPSSDLRAARRLGHAPTERTLTVGFRCAYDL